MAKLLLPHLPTILILLIVFLPFIFSTVTEKSKHPFACISPLKVERFNFRSTAKPPGSHHRLFLGGAGVRGIQIKDQFVKFTAIGVYLERKATPLLAAKWKRKSAEELTTSVQFPMDVVSGPFKKLTIVTFIKPLTGVEYSSKVIENCIANWKAVGIYTKAEEKAAKKFLKSFKKENFPRGSSILFAQYPKGILRISFRNNGPEPKKISATIRNKAMSEAVLYSIIGENGVSPAARKSLATRMSKLMMEEGSETPRCIRE